MLDFHLDRITNSFIGTAVCEDTNSELYTEGLLDEDEVEIPEIEDGKKQKNSYNLRTLMMWHPLR